MRVVIAGSRNIVDDEYGHFLRLETLCLRFEKEFGPITMVISGTARGPDRLGEIYARDRGLDTARFPGKWDLYGKAAGMIRNKEMADFADGAIILWDGKSKGTKNMIQHIRDQEKPIILDIFEPMVYNYVHNPDGSITQVKPGDSPSMNDPAYD